MTKIFVTGVTGYIGGDALFAISNAHPNYEITCLVRNGNKGAQVAKAYPKARLVYGDLDSYDLIRDESTKADIVCNFADCDHQGAAHAIVDGLSKHITDKPGYLIHTSGTGILCVDDFLRNIYGTSTTKMYDDWDNVGVVTNMPDQAWHRNVDKIVLAAANNSNGAVKTAIVCPPTIYGPGRGPGNRTSDQVPKMVDAVLKRGKGFYVGEGQNLWTSIHVHDLSQLYLRLVEAAINGGPPATWDNEGYYFAENGDLAWGEMARKIAAECHRQGFIKTKDVDGVTAEQANELALYGGPRWGFNSRCRAIRARKLLDWQPKGKSLEEELPGLIQERVKELRLMKSHAAEAAGL